MREATFVENADQLGDFFRWLSSRRCLLGVDTETTGLEWWTPHFTRLFTISDGDVSYAVPMDRWAGVTHEVEQYHGEIVMHNAKFDLHALGWHRKVHDSMIMSHLADPRPPHGLKELGELHVERKASWYERQMKADFKEHGWDWATVPVNWPSYWQYGAYDPWLTVKLAEHYGHVTQTSLYDLELEFMQVIRRTEERGMRVDLAYVRSKIDGATVRCAEIDEELRREWGMGEEGAGSNPTVVSCLLANGVRLTHTTAGGNVSVSEEALAGVDHPIVKLVLEHRHHAKRKGAWFQPFLEGSGEYLHPDIRTVGTRTARLTVSRPAMQTLPRGPEVRDAIIARDGHFLMLADYKQAELRVLAHFAQDKDMIRAFLDGEDLHQMLADVAGVPRQVAKPSWFAKVYGAGIHRFSETAGITEDEARAIYAALDARFPGIKRFIAKTADRAAERLVSDGEAWVRTPWGRYLPADLDHEHKLVNYLIQSTATADLPKEKAVLLDAAGWGEYITMPVHDEFIFDIPDYLREEAEHDIPKIMTELDKFRVPMEVDYEVVPRWGAKYPDSIAHLHGPAYDAGDYRLERAR